MTAPIGLTAGLAGGSIVTLFFLWRLGLRGLSDSGYAFSELGFGDFWKNAEVAFALVAQLLLLAAYGTVLASVVSRTPKLNSRPWLWGTVAGTFPALCAFAYFWHAHCQPWDDCSFNWRAFGVFMTLVGYYVGFFGIPAAYVARSLRRNADHRNEITGPPIERVVAASLLAGTCATLPLVIFFGVCAAIGQPGEGTGAQLTLARDVWSSFGNPDTRFFEDTNQPWVRREAIWIVMFVGYGLFFGVLPLLTIASTLMLAAKRSIFERPLLFGVALGIIPSVVIWIFWARAHKMPPLLLVVGIVCTYGIPAAYLIRMFLGTRTSPVTMPSG